jgi:HlyD family secretion protein
MKFSKPALLKRFTWLNKGIWIALILLLAGGGAAWYFLGGSSSVKAQTTPTASKIYTSTVKRGDIQYSASGSGTLIAWQSVDLSFSTEGTVTELNVKAGDTVKAGDVLASIGNGKDLEADVTSLQLQLLQAQQTLNNLQQNADVALAQAYQDWVTVQGTYNDALTASQRTAYARCSQEVVTKYKAALESATSRLEQIGLRNYGSDGWINAKNNYDTAKANYSYCATYTADEKTDAQAALDVAKTTLQQAETKYKTLKTASGIDPDKLALYEAKVTDLQTKLALAQNNLKGVTLTAPFDGKVVYIAADKGTMVNTSKFITVADVSRAAIQVSVDETDVDKLAMNSPATITLDAVPDRVFSGKVVQVNPQMVTSGQYKVVQGVIELDENSTKAVQSLPLGLSATVTVLNKEVKGALLVPVTALKSLGNQEYAVLVVSSDGQSKQQTIKIGIKDGTNAEVLDGLVEGEAVSIGTATKSSSSSSQNSTSGAGGPPMDGGAGGPPMP